MQISNFGTNSVIQLDEEDYIFPFLNTQLVACTSSRLFTELFVENKSVL